MAGVKGRCGGKRDGAGRKRKPPVAVSGAAPVQAAPKATKPAVVAAPEKAEPSKALAELLEQSSFTDPLNYLRAVWLGRIDANSDQVRAATAALPYLHPKIGEGGKKELKQQAAQAASSGRFSASSPPKLALVKSR